jgi:hypothetical protein
MIQDLPPGFMVGKEKGHRKFREDESSMALAWRGPSLFFGNQPIQA